MIQREDGSCTHLNVQVSLEKRWRADNNKYVPGVLVGAGIYRGCAEQKRWILYEFVDRV